MENILKDRNDLFFSIIIPTRNQVERLKQLLDSFKTSTKHPKAIEIIMVIDSDDSDSLSFNYSGLTVKKIVVEPGLNMGELNSAGYKASTGEYIMLLNDDVIIRSRDWDEKVLSAFNIFSDGIVLVHVNDTIFEDKLCTFPFVSRQFCEMANGICPKEYVRYRIDDHIYNIFNLLGILGHRRIVYLPDVIFEHTNRHLIGKGKLKYHPIKHVHDSDTVIFNSLLIERKELAVKLMQHIENNFNSEKIKFWRKQLDAVTDSIAIRTPEHVLRINEVSHSSVNNPRVTIGIVSSDINKDYAKKCVALVKKHTKNFDLIILDNNKALDFNHPREMNRLISICRTDYLVLMDDDVFVEAGWLEALLKCMDEKTGVVAPLHKNGAGELSFSGVYLMGDGYGTHAHLTDKPVGPRVCQCLCSALILIDLKKCSGIFFNEAYNKYFLDLDYSLKVWEAGYKNICTPDAIVTHLAGATVSHGSMQSLSFLKKDLKIFILDWIKSGRLQSIENNVWARFPFLLMLSDIPKRIKYITDDIIHQDLYRFKEAVLALLEIIKPFYLFKSFMFSSMDDYIHRCFSRGDTLRAKFCEDILHKNLKNISLMPSGLPPILIESYNGYNLVEYKDYIYAVPHRLGSMNLMLATHCNRKGILSGKNIQEVRCIIDKEIGLSDEKNSQENQPVKQLVPVLFEEGFKGFNIIHFDSKFYSIPQGEGTFDINKVFANGYRWLFIDETAQGVKDRINRNHLIYKYIFRPARYCKRMINSVR